MKTLTEKLKKFFNLFRIKLSAEQKRLRNIWLKIMGGFLAANILTYIIVVFGTYAWGAWIAIASISVITLYLIVILFVASVRSSLEYSDRVADLVFLFPSRPVGFFLLIVFLACNTLDFSYLYYYERAAYCNGNLQLDHWIDCLFLSFGTVSTVPIVSFSPDSNHSRWLILAQEGSNLVLLLGAFSFLVARISVFSFLKPLDGQRIKKWDGNNNELITEKNVEKLTGFTLENWCEFSGAYAGIENTVRNKEKFTIAGNMPKLKLAFTGNTFNYSLDVNLERQEIAVSNLPKEYEFKIRIIKIIERLVDNCIKEKFYKIDCLEIPDFETYILFKAMGLLTIEPPDFEEQIAGIGDQLACDKNSLAEFLLKKQCFKCWVSKSLKVNLQLNLSEYLNSAAY